VRRGATRPGGTGAGGLRAPPPLLGRNAPAQRIQEVDHIRRSPLLRRCDRLTLGARTSWLFWRRFLHRAWDAMVISRFGTGSAAPGALRAQASMAPCEIIRHGILF
jgi:hypothetical protein